MANSYLQFSELLPALTLEQVEWLRVELSGPPLPDDMVDEDEQEAFALQWFAERGITDPGQHSCFSEIAENWPGFEHGLRAATDGVEGEFWVYAEEAAELEHLVNIVQRFLKRFRPDTCFGLSWAGTCSKLRIGEFGGGAVFVTAKRVHYMSSWDFLDRHRLRFEDSKKKIRAIKPKKTTHQKDQKGVAK